MTSYYAPKGGLPPQTSLMTQRAVFTDAYCFIPKGCFSDIVTSYLPGWNRHAALDDCPPDVGLFGNFQPVCDGGRARRRF
jgi:glyoxylate utilization-related uncharacterized protein